MGSLSAAKRESILGFGPAGWDQAVAELWQVLLTAQYHLHAAFDWFAAIRSAADAQVLVVIERIKAAGGGAIAIVGERGSGKTTLIERIVTQCAGSITVTCSVDGLAGLRVQLSRALGLSATTTLELAAKSLDGRVGDRALLIDDAQFLIRPTMGGLAEFDGLLQISRRYSRNCTWALVFDDAIWRFIERSRGRQPLFDEVIQLCVRSQSHRPAGLGRVKGYRTSDRIAHRTGGGRAPLR